MPKLTKTPDLNTKSTKLNKNHNFITKTSKDASFTQKKQPLHKRCDFQGLKHDFNAKPITKTSIIAKMQPL